MGDKGYLSSSQQLDLFSSCNVKLKTLMRSNQKNYNLYPPAFKKFKKRIETLFSQLCDQFMLKRNYVKKLIGLSVRILTKVTSISLLQYINLKNGKPINNLKYALASQTAQWVNNYQNLNFTSNLKQFFVFYQRPH